MKIETIVGAFIVIFIIVIFIPIGFRLIFPTNYNSTNWNTSVDSNNKTIFVLIPVIGVIAVILGILYKYLSYEHSTSQEPIQPSKPNPYLTDFRIMYLNDNRRIELAKLLKKLKNVPEYMRDELLK